MDTERAAFLWIDRSIELDDGICELAGGSWFSSREFPLEQNKKYDVTFGIRLFEGYAGRGLGRHYIEAANQAAKPYAANHGVWLSADERNLRARRLYENAGYSYRGILNKRVYMVSDHALAV